MADNDSQTSTPIAALVTQVTILSQTVESAVLRLNQVTDQKNDMLTAATQRFESLSNQYGDELTAIRDTIAQLQTLKENWLVALEALHKSIDEQDRVIDDLAKITQRIGQMELTYERALAASQAQ